MTKLRRVLVTGAAGDIGGMLRDRLGRPGRSLRLLDVVPAAAPRGDEPVEIHTGSVTDPDVLRTACAGMDAVVHLAGIPREAAWSDILHTNVHGTWCVLEAARAAGITRVVLASSNHAVGFAERAAAPAGGLPGDLPPRPDTYYGWSKAAIESLGRLYTDRFGMDVVCLRIGACAGRPFDRRNLSNWLSPDDMGRLVEAALTTDQSGFRLVWGVSANSRSWWSPELGARLGFAPTDDAEAYAAQITGGSEADPLPDERVGGEFCSTPLGLPGPATEL